MNKIDFLKRMENGVWVLAENEKYRKLSDLLPIEGDNEVNYKAVKITCKNGMVDMVHLNKRTALVFRYPVDGINIGEEHGYVVLEIKGRPVMSVSQKDEESDNKYNKRLIKDGYLTEEEMNTFRKDKEKASLPKLVLRH